MELDAARLGAYRGRATAGWRVRTAEQALAFVAHCGFCYAFTPGKGELPGLFTVLDTDREGQRWDWAWKWRDQLQESRRVYAARLVGQKPCLVQPDWLPAFYGLAGHTGDLAEDMATAAAEGRVSQMARTVYAYLDEKGPTSTRVLLKALGDRTRETKQAIEKGLLQLEEALLIAPLRPEGGHSIARVYDLFPRAWPDAAGAGADLSSRQAAGRILAHWLGLAGALTAGEVERGLAWALGPVRRAIRDLEGAGAAVPVTLKGKPGWAFPDLA